MYEYVPPHFACIIYSFTEIGSKKPVATEDPMPTESKDVVRYEVSHLSLAQVCSAALLRRVE